MPHDALVAAFDKQAHWCDELGSPFTAGLLRFLAADLARCGALRELLPAWPGDPVRDALALRVGAALHALVLTGSDERLAAGYPPHAAGFDAEVVGPVVESALRREPDHLRRWLHSAPQTNEVRRSAALIGGFSEIARRTGLPLALYEIGASAGLNLLWDRFHYTLGGQQWGPADSPVRLDAEWRGNAPALLQHIAVASRAGCDVAPIDAGDPQGALRLAAFVWPDQRERLDRLQRAIEMARASKLKVDALDAGEWLEHKLARLQPGVASVVYHSLVWQYLPDATRKRIRAHLDALGARATPQSPLAWLRLEPLRDDAASWLRLTAWPGGREKRLARAHPHVAWVEWLGECVLTAPGP